MASHRANNGFNRTRGNFWAGKAGLAQWPRRLTQTLGFTVSLVATLEEHFRDEFVPSVPRSEITSCVWQFFFSWPLPSGVM
jgi:hypothetical protein